MPALADRPPSIEVRKQNSDDACLYRLFNQYARSENPCLFRLFNQYALQGSYSVYYGEAINLFSLESDNNYIKLTTRISNEYDLLIEQYGDIDKAELLAIADETISVLLDLFPDKISAELTYQNSLVVTFKKSENLFFFERFFKPEDNEEVIFSYYEGSIKKPSFSGTFQEALTRLSMEIELNTDQLFTAYIR